MITAIVTFTLRQRIDRAEAVARFQSTAPNYRGLAGLVRKYYLFGDGDTVAGVYLWESRTAAEKFYDAKWRAMVTEKYGAAPDVRYFDTPVIVDNVSDQILIEDAA